MKHRNQDISWEELDYFLDVRPEDGLIYWKNPLGNKSAILQGKLAGHFGHRFKYVMISVNNKDYKRHRLIWFYVHKKWPANDIDHINGNKSDDRISNLREATRSQNMFNTKAHRDSSSGIKGVCWDKKSNKWRATIVAGGLRTELGRFQELPAAIRARRAAEKINHGEFVRQR